MADNKYSPPCNRNLGILPAEIQVTRQNSFAHGFRYAFDRITAENRVGDYSSRASRRDRRAVAKEITRAARRNRGK
jgi:hypothetical protein